MERLDIRRVQPSAATDIWRRARAALAREIASVRRAELWAPVAVVAAILVLLVAVGVWRADPVRLTILGGLATVGLFALLAVLAGHARVEAADPATRQRDGLARLAADTIADAVLVTDGAGRMLYINAAFERMLERGDRHDPLPRLVSGNPAAEEAVFRLFRHVERGETASETVHIERVASESPGDDNPVQRTDRWLRLTARPMPGARPDGGSDDSAAILWQATDITADRQDAALAQAGLRRTLAQYEALPVGILVADSSERVLHLNDRLARLLELDAGEARSGDLTLADVIGADGRAMLDGALAGSEPGPVRVELTLLRQRRFSQPATVLVERSAATGVLSAVVLDRALTDAGPTLAARDVDAGAFFHSAPIGIATLSDTGVVTSANAALGRLLLINRSPVQSPATLILARGAEPETRTQIEAAIAAAIAGEVRIQPVEITLGAAKEFTRRLVFAPLRVAHDEPPGAMLYVVDATEQKALEAKFAQSQRMDAVGRLVGGIAHDFNNVLTAIIGWSELLLGTLRPGDPGFRNVSNIKSAAGRAAGLVTQLLAFSRQQTLQPEVLNLGEVLSEQSVLITRLLGERIDLKINQDRELWYVKADRTQFTQVVMNLAVNARDAMPGGGRLTIRTRNVTERDSHRNGGEAPAVGEYVLIEVKDTGTGMPPEVKARIFEPFYTTKGVGKGTGLGLSTVYGIVKQTGGYVFVDSEPGRGTTFRVYLPRHVVDAATLVERQKPTADRMRDLTGTGRILIVEDEDSVRSLTDEALRGKGYTVLQASTGLEALEVMREHDFAFDLVVSDVIMPEMDGPTLLSEIRKVRPDMRVILVSGYPDEAFKTNLAPDARFAFLQKPYSIAQLAAKVKEELAR